MLNFMQVSISVYFVSFVKISIKIAGMVLIFKSFFCLILELQKLSQGEFLTNICVKIPPVKMTHFTVIYLSQPHNKGISRGLVPLYLSGSSSPSRRQPDPHLWGSENELNCT